DTDDTDDTEDDDGDDDTDDTEDDGESLGDGGTPAAAGDAEDLGGIQGPDTDEEMPLAEHIEEMMRRLAVVFLFGGLATLVAVTESTDLINYFWGYHIPAPLENRPRLYGPLELPLTRLKVAGLAGVVVGLPAFVYQTYRFMKPGLYENERRYYLAAVPTSLVLGGIGIAFAHFLVLPAIFSYFTTYTSDAATIAFGLAETFNLIVIMLAFMAIVFQIPLFIMLAIMMNLVTRLWLEDKRLIFWGAFLGIAFLFSPDPTGMAPIIVTLTMIVLFEGTLAILRWTGN
ncbi:twin-arginine translocase subunit TatC, partial [Halorubrum sp. F4]|uniref:twin-arginine translocase subunit TatC n=1 Tax=Halorubrum sp. F4 TaxID=2989715 RepID=UPI0024814420